MIHIRRKPCVYPNVDLLMFLERMSITDLSQKSGIEYKSLCKKLNGTAKLSFKDGIAIYNSLDRLVPLERMFDYAC